MCKHMVDGNEQKGHGKTTAVSEDAEAEIFITFKWKQYILIVTELQINIQPGRYPHIINALRGMTSHLTPNGFSSRMSLRSTIILAWHSKTQIITTIIIPFAISSLSGSGPSALLANG